MEQPIYFVVLERDRNSHYQPPHLPIDRVVLSVACDLADTEALFREHVARITATSPRQLYAVYIAREPANPFQATAAADGSGSVSDE